MHLFALCKLCIGFAVSLGRLATLLGLLHLLSVSMKSLLWLAGFGTNGPPVYTETLAGAQIPSSEDSYFNYSGIRAFNEF